MKKVTVYASFTNEQRKQGSNGTTEKRRIPLEQRQGPGGPYWTKGRPVILTSGQPFIFEADENDCIEFWVAKITLPIDHIFVDTDEFKCPDKTLAINYHEETMQYGSYIEMSSLSHPDTRVEWLDAIMVNWPEYPLAMVNSQVVDNWPHGEI